MIDKNTFSFKRLKNRYNVVRSYTGKKAVNSAHPVELILEITDHCNLACPMCPRPNMTRTLGHMEMDVFKSIIDQVKDYIELVYLSGGLGEPTMHPKLGEMIQYARSQNVRLGISTNATLLYPRVANMLLDTPPNLILLSLDGATKETHEKIRLGSTFETTMANVEYFATEKEKRGAKEPYIVVQMIYMPENQMEADAFRAKWSIFKGINDIRLKRFLSLQGAKLHPDDDPPEEEHQFFSCILPWRQLSIAWDGSLALCCRDLNFKDPIGSVKTHTIKELWNCQKMIQYREKLANRKKSEIDLCKGCSTVKTNSITRAGSVMFDDLTIRKLLPVVEKIAVKTSLKLGDY